MAVPTVVNGQYLKARKAAERPAEPLHSSEECASGTDLNRKVRETSGGNPGKRLRNRLRLCARKPNTVLVLGLQPWRSCGIYKEGGTFGHSFASPPCNLQGTSCNLQALPCNLQAAPCNLQSDTLQLVSRTLQLASNVLTFEKAYSSTCLLCRSESSESIFHLKEAQSLKMKILKRQRLSSMEERKVFYFEGKTQS